MTLVRNDPAQYDELVDEWWQPRGQFAMLHWIAQSRAELIPQAQPGGVLVDVGCGGGLMYPHVAALGYCTIGVDFVESALKEAQTQGMSVVRGNAEHIPIASGVASVVVAGEILEHVEHLDAVVGEICRILAPGGLVVLDTIANTRIAKCLAIDVAERIPGGAPRGIHDVRLFVDRRRLMELFAENGVALTLRGIRPSVSDTLLWALKKKAVSRMVPTFTTAVLFQGWGRKHVIA